MRTEEDLRAALAELECHAPDALAVLATVRAEAGARQAIFRRRLTWSLAASATAALAAAVLSAGVFGRVTHHGPPARAPSAAAVLRQLAARAATQRASALGPVLYTMNAIWGPDASAAKQRNGMLAVDEIDLQKEWLSASARYLTTADPSDKNWLNPLPSSYTKLDPRNNLDWNWRNPATLPASPAALRRHLLSEPRSKPTGMFKSRPPLTPDEIVFSNALQFMTSEPLRPAVRASMLRLLADIAQRSSGKFAVLGTITDRAGHRDIAIAGESNEIWALSPYSTKYERVHTGETQLAISFFDQATGWLRAREYATCPRPVSTIKVVSARCALGSYEQDLVTKAVPSLPSAASASSKYSLTPYGFPWWPVIP